MNEYENPWIQFDENENDWIIASESTLEIPRNTNTIKHYYNQAAQKRTYSWCGIYASLGAISDLTWYKFTTQEILECIDLAEAKYGWVEWEGMYLSKAIDCARAYWNTKFPEKKVFSTRFTLGDDTSLEALQKWHSLVVWYKTSREYNLDSQDDGMIQGKDFPKWGGHLVRCNKGVYIDDNYDGVKKYNRYENDKIFELKKNEVYFPSAYLFLKYNTMWEYETQYKAKYGNGTIYWDIDWAIKKLEIKDGIERERFFFNLIWLERAK